MGGGGIQAAALVGRGDARSSDATGRWGNEEDAKPSRRGAWSASILVRDLSSPSIDSLLNDSMKLCARFSFVLFFLLLNMMVGDLSFDELRLFQWRGHTMWRR
jgi:hypothetical protein